jgi:hypothetical protein
MQQHKNGLNEINSLKDTNLNSINPAFEFDKYIGVEDIKAEVEQVLKQGIETQERKTNRFPVEVFPLPIQQVITGTNENLNFPIDFIGASLLYAVRFNQ